MVSLESISLHLHYIMTDKLQAVLCMAARLVLQLPYRSSVTEAMHRKLHWLDVEDRVTYKIGPYP